MAIKLLDNTAKFEIYSEHDESVDNKSDAGKAGIAKYMESLSISDLTLIEGKGSPTPFVVRCLTASEAGALQEKHYVYDTTTKKSGYLYGYSAYLLDCFALGCLGIKNSAGETQKVSADDVGLLNAISIGSTLIYMTSVGKNLKNV